MGKEGKKAKKAVNKAHPLAGLKKAVKKEGKKAKKAAKKEKKTAAPAAAKKTTLFTKLYGRVPLPPKVEKRETAAAQAMRRLSKAMKKVDEAKDKGAEHQTELAGILAV